MGFLDKIEKVVGIANGAANLASTIKANDLLSGINLSNVNASNINSIQGSIENVINQKVNEITSQVTSSIDVGEIESIANSIDIGDLDIPNIPGLEGISFR